MAYKRNDRQHAVETQARPDMFIIGTVYFYPLCFVYYDNRAPRLFYRDILVPILAIISVGLIFRFVNWGWKSPKTENGNYNSSLSSQSEFFHFTF